MPFAAIGQAPSLLGEGIRGADDDSMTSLLQEQEEQRRWRLRPEYADVDWFDALVRGEFLPADEQTARISSRLQNVIGFCAENVPYYRELFGRAKISPADFGSAADLPLLPMLTRTEVQERQQDLIARRLPNGQRAERWTSTSGTTGQPVKVLHTAQSRRVFHILKQRELRWFRFDPMGILASIRPKADLPQPADGRPSPEDATRPLPHWPSAGRFFETGPFFGFGSSNPIDAQVAWLQKIDPDYLITQAAQLEHLALAFQGRERPQRLAGIESISQQLTPEMRHRAEAVFGVPVHENYGLNEFGLIATRCPEGGRYHVHSEHYLVEIVDDAGAPCPPGRTGRVLVTTLVNPAMPLLRYDADDLAEAVAGPCPCGRMLPAFGAITGRYRRIAALPPGTWDYWRAMAITLERMPGELIRPLRQYQLHQYRDGRFELRLGATAPLDPAFLERVRAAWQAAAKAGEPPARLEILEMAEIPVKRGTKFQSFTSDFAPGPDVPPASAPG